MTTEQMDWLDDERAGRHAADKLVPKGRPKAFRPDLRSEPPAFRPAPEGWYTFGTHAAADVRLEFSSELDEAGDPLWERPLWPEMHTDEEWAQIRDAMDGAKPDPMGNARLADRLRAMGAIRTKHQSGETVEWVNAPLAVVVDQAHLAASAFSDDLHEWAEDHTHYTRDARDQCAAGDHRYAVLLDDAAEREKLRELIDRPQGEHPGISDEFWEKVPSADREAFSRFLTQTVTVNPEDYVTMAEEPIEQRLRRAYENGLKQGLELGHQAFGNWDHR